MNAILCERHALINARGCHPGRWRERRLAGERRRGKAATQHPARHYLRPFQDRAEAGLMERFHTSDGPVRADLVGPLRDVPYCQNAQPIVYDGAPESLKRR